MLPSDHYVRFYNELFKMLEQKSHKELQNYWMEISRLQETIIGPYIREKGLQGMYEYWNRVRIEENCEADLTVTNDYFEFKMNKCPSLTKVMDNDASPFEYYCDHCAGWIEPIMKKYGYFYVCDIISRKEPVCVERIYTDKEKAKDFAGKAKLLADPYGNNEYGK